jgi:hypothetical protein
MVLSLTTVNYSKIRIEIGIDNSVIFCEKGVTKPLNLMALIVRLLLEYQFLYLALATINNYGI